MLIACATDEGYAEMAGVMLRSIARNGDVGEAQIVLIGDGLSTATVDALGICADGLRYEHIDLASAAAHIRALPVSFYSTAIYIRLLLPDLVPDDGMLLYLDSDTLVMNPIRPIFDTPLGGMSTAAVLDQCRPDVLQMANARLNRPDAAPYYNSGVLLFDLAAWRKDEIGQRCIHLAQKRTDYWPDQDALNLVLDGQITTLDRTWNFFSHEPLTRADFENARIVHFIPDKPISQNCRHPLFEDYLALRETTPWRGKPLASLIRQRRISNLTRMAAERVRRHKTSK